MYFAKFRMKSVTSLIHAMFIIIFNEIHIPAAALKYFQSQYVTCICCSEFQEIFQGPAALT